MAATLFSISAKRDGFAAERPAAERVHFGAAPVDAISREDAAQWLLGALLEHHAAVSGTAPEGRGPNAFLVTLAPRKAFRRRR